METVATVKFIGQNITRSGLQQVETKPDVAKPQMHRSVTYVQSPTTTTKTDSDQERTEAHHRGTTLSNTDNASSDDAQSEQSHQSCGMETRSVTVGLKASETQVLMHRDTVCHEHTCNSSPTRSDKENEAVESVNNYDAERNFEGDNSNEEEEEEQVDIDQHLLPSIDDILASKLRESTPQHSK